MQVFERKWGDGTIYDNSWDEGCVRNWASFWKGMDFKPKGVEKVYKEGREEEERYDEGLEDPEKMIVLREDVELEIWEDEEV